MEEAPVGASSYSSPTGSLDSLDVRGLRALRALHNLERHALALGQRLVAVHADRREVHEDVVAALALDEAVALLVREPLNGALSQLFLLTQNDGPGTEPPTDTNRPEFSSVNGIRNRRAAGRGRRDGVLEHHCARHRADAAGP